MSENDEFEDDGSLSDEEFEDKDGLIIEAVKSYPILWNLKRGDYKDGLKKGRAWCKVAQLVFLDEKKGKHFSFIYF